MLFNSNLNIFDLEPFRRREAPDPFWARTPPKQTDSTFSPLWTVGGIAVGGIGFGVMPIGGGHRGVDYYRQAAQWIENKSPGRIFKTFGVSEFLFPFTAGQFSQRAMNIPSGGKLIPSLEAVYGSDRLLKYTIEQDVERLVEVGEKVRISRTEFVFGQKRILGARISSRTQQLIALSRAYASSQIQRFNILLREFSELSILHGIPGFKSTQRYIGDKLGRIGLRLPKHILSVPHGPALKMLGGLAGRAAVVGLGIHSLSYLDYLRRTEERGLKTTAGGAGAGALGFGALFRNHKAMMIGAVAGALVGGLPQFDEGIYAGVAGMYTKGRLLHAKFSDITGLTSAAQKQEDLAPGITELQTPLGFAGAGALTRYLSSYVGRLSGLKGFKESGKTLVKGGLFGLGVYAALAGIAAVASGTYMPGILASDVSYDELKDIYSGKKDIAVRKGRWWEFGRCVSEHTEIITQFGFSKKAKDIQKDDLIVTKSGERKKVLSVIRRDLKENEEVFEIRAALNRSKSEIFVTEDHPLLTPEGWKKAKYITLNDWLAFPKPKLTDQIKEFKGIELTENLGFLVGHFLAEGNLMRKRGEIWGIELCASLREGEYLEKDRDVISKYWNKWNKIIEKKEQGVLRFRPGNRDLGQWFNDLLYTSGDKLLSENFLDFDIEFLKGIIKGYWNGDGGTNKGMKYITGARKNLLQQIQTILLALGIPTSLLEHGSFSKQVNKHCNSWKILWNTNDSLEQSSNKRKNIRIDNDYVYSRVYKKELINYTDQVIDFEIEDEHSFVGPGFILHNTPWEGTKVDYYRQHWYPKMLSRGRDISLYGGEQEKWEYDPVLHPVKALFDEEFKYHRELKNQYTRPYPVTGTYFEDIPFIGPILAGTLGKLIKPARFMHTDKWLRGGEIGEKGTEVYNVPHAGSHESISELGGLPPDIPKTQYDSSGIIGESIYRLNELRGLTGFMHGAFKEHLTGSQDYYDKARRFETSTRAYGSERWYWDMNLGGLLGLTEGFRRYVPHRRRQIELYNPIPNLMPSWMPGASYYLDFHTGDPFTKVKEGDIRLPGRGYEALHPELKGLHPEEYPTFHKFKILADVAMWSDEFKQARTEMRKAQKRGQLSTLEMQQFQVILRQVANKKKKRKFQEYRFAATDVIKSTVKVQEVLPGGRFTTNEFGDTVMTLAGVNMSSAAIDRLARETKGDTLESKRESLFLRQQELLSSVLKPNQEIDILMPCDPLDRYKIGMQITMPVVIGGLNRQLVQQGLAEQTSGPLSKYVEYSALQRGFATAWEIITHKGETPLEILTPFAPMTKFVHARSAIEEYEKTQVFGTQSAFWQHPIEHFFKPFGRTVRGLTDEDYIPEEIQHRRQLQDYFDKLKYVKYNRLEYLAKEAGEHELSQELHKIKRRTLFGVDPYGSFSNILKALPGSERDFFMAFANAKTPEERERILQLLPPNERAIYLARWHGRLAKQMMAEFKSGATDDLSLLAKLSRFKKFEGKSYTPELLVEYQESETEESYADWQRSKELEEYFQDAPLPGPNWIGWHPKVDLDDIKLKIIETLGEDMHDYGLWQSRARTLRRKPYLDDEVTAQLMATDHISREDIKKRLKELLSPYVDNLEITAHYLHKINPQNEIEIELSDNRVVELQEYFENPDRE